MAKGTFHFDTKKIVSSAKTSAARCAGVIATSYVNNTILKDSGTVGSKIVKIKPALYLVAGILGESMVKNQYAQAAFQGLSTFGGLKLAYNMIPDGNIGLGYLGANPVEETVPTTFTDVSAGVSGTDQNIWEQLAGMETYTEPTELNGDEDTINGVSDVNLF